MLLTKYALATFTALHLCVAQTNTVEPCAQVSAYQAAKNDIPASTAEACLQSVPLNQQDALEIIDALSGTFQWQSTIGILKNPPADWPFPPVDMFKELSNLRSQITSGTLNSEIFFERNLTTIFTRARDGHFFYKMDALSLFDYKNGWGALSVVSLDGQLDPALYLQVEVAAFVNGRANAPSAITSINGQPAADFIASEAINGTMALYQDVDAAFNSFMYQPITRQASYDIGSFAAQTGVYPGDYTTLTFANGSTLSKYNYAVTEADFTGVFDGPSFASKFCNATVKAQNIGNPQKSNIRKRQMHSRDLIGRATNADTTRLPNYPAPAFISPDGSISGYGLSGAGFEDTAVLVITIFPQAGTATPVFQSTLTQFMNWCRSQKKKQLIIDVTNNPGGSVMLVYEVFKQLFPNIEPYATGNYRLQDAFTAYGQAVAANTAVATKDQPGNVTAYRIAGGYSIFDVPVFLRDDGTKYTELSQMVPKNPAITVRGDGFTNLHRWDLNDVPFSLASGNITVSGYNGKPVGAQPFEPQNIVIVGDGQCSSSCTTLSHLLKYQGKVKSIAIGGRPQSGPMQSQGGVKGSQITEIGYLGLLAAGFNQQQVQALDKTSSQPLFDPQNALTLVLRTDSADIINNQDLSFNSKNNIAEGDTTFMPLQFVYEAADCRLYNRALWTISPGWKWYTVAQQAFGLNGTTAWSGCVQGSTKHSTSLSGNAKLYNNGVPNNVTTFLQTGSQGGSGGGGGSGSQNGSSRTQRVGGGLTALIALVFLVTAVVMIPL